MAADPGGWREAGSFHIMNETPKVWAAENYNGINVSH